jgi:hypothetical protein
MSEEQMKELVEQGGAQWLGLSCGLIMFRDPKTGSTCALYPAALADADDIRAALARKREQFAEKV